MFSALTMLFGVNVVEDDEIMISNTKNIFQYTWHTLVKDARCGREAARQILFVDYRTHWSVGSRFTYITKLQSSPRSSISAAVF